MNQREKRILNTIYANLESISWKTQTMDAQETYKGIKLMFQELDLCLRAIKPQ